MTAEDLVRAVAAGELVTAFVWRCFACDQAMDYAESLNGFPDATTCPYCDEDREFRDHDIEVVYRTPR